MQTVERLKQVFSLNSLFTESISKRWKVVAFSVSGVAFLALGAYVTSLISLPTVFVITLSIGACVGYLFFKNSINPKKEIIEQQKEIIIEQQKEITNEEKIEFLNKIVSNDLTPMVSNINEKLIVFGYRLKDKKNEDHQFESATNQIELATNQNSEEIIKGIKTFFEIESYTSNSILEIELAIFSKIDNNVLEYKSLYKAYIGLSQEFSRPVLEGKIPKIMFDETFQTTPKWFNVIKIDRSRWNNDGTFA